MSERLFCNDNSHCYAVTNQLDTDRSKYLYYNENTIEII